MEDNVVSDFGEECLVLFGVKICIKFHSIWKLCVCWVLMSMTDKVMWLLGFYGSYSYCMFGCLCEFFRQLIHKLYLIMFDIFSINTREWSLSCVSVHFYFLVLFLGWHHLDQLMLWAFFGFDFDKIKYGFRYLSVGCRVCGKYIVRVEVDDKGLFLILNAHRATE